MRWQMHGVEDLFVEAENTEMVWTCEKGRWGYVGCGGGGESWRRWLAERPLEEKVE